MKKLIVITCLLSMATFASAALDPHSGTVTATTLGSTLVTDLPEFDSSLGTLTGVTITLNLDLAPFGQLISFNGDGVFQPNQSFSVDLTPANIITLERGSDSWNVAAPNVASGTIYGSGQTIPEYPPAFKIPGGNSAPLNWSDNGVNLADYIGTGTLSFETSGSTNFTSSVSPLWFGAGTDITGTASVVYEYVPEPATLALLGLGGLLLRKRK